MKSDAVLAVIKSHIQEVLPGLAEHKFQSSDSLEALGANSVDRSEIVIMTLETLNLNIPLVETFGPKNIGELADLLAEKCKIDAAV